MMISERNLNFLSNPTVHVPPWSSYPDDPTAGISFSSLNSPTTANANFSPDDYSFFLHNVNNDSSSSYLNDVVLDSNSDEDLDLPTDTYSCDQFRMYEFKIRKCARARSHDWTECPYAHPGEKARRRDPRKYHYSGSACPDFRKGVCKKGDACEYAHGVFECWLHPARYRTQPCKDGQGCRRRVCFFAHAPEQMRVLSPRSVGPAEFYDGSPRRLCFEGVCSPGESPPMSPMSGSNSVNSLSRSFGSNSVSEMVGALRQLQLNKVKSGVPASWAMQMGSPTGYGSPRARPGFCSLPATPTRVVGRVGSGFIDIWDKSGLLEEEPVMERVESGRGLRARMFEKLSKENPLDQVDTRSPNPDVGWVSELIM